MINKKNKKRISILVLVLFANQLFFPSISFATGGAQPEFSRFVPYDSSQLVNPFTGDFTYNIPLLNVPGPGGGYPVNIAYNSGITADQEASWVGLGWTLNPGSMDRQTRGIPDDFDGDQKVIKEKYMKPNRTTVVGVAASASASELFGFDLTKLNIPNAQSASLSLNITINNYTGYKFGLGLGFSSDKAAQVAPSQLGRAVDLTAAGERPGGYFEKGYIKRYSKALLQEDWDSKFDMANIKSNLITKSAGALGAGILFAGSSTETNDFSFPKSSAGFEFTGKFGGDLLGLTTDLTLNGAYSSSYYSDNKFELDAYGYMHSARGLDKADESYVSMDFYKSNKTELNQYTKYLGVPVLTHDLFVANGQSVSGVFRPSLSYVQLLQNSEFESTSGSGGMGAEVNNTSISTQFGINANGSGTYNRSGFWSGGRNRIYGHLEKPFDRQGSFEPWAFAELGELAPSNWSNSPLMDNYRPQKFNLDREFTGTSFKAQVQNDLTKTTATSRTSLGNDLKRTNRLSRKQNLVSWTGHNLYNYKYDNGYSHYTVDGNAFRYENNSIIQRLEVENAKGKHVFGIPVYVNTSENRLFSFQPGSGFDYFKGNVATYSAAEDGKENASGRAQLFESEKFSDKYPGGYLLTEILSPNYVDVDNNGPSKSDFGTYTLFEYKKPHNNFISYSPPRKSASSLMGYYSVNSLADEKDDVCTYTVTDSEQYYLKKIETKTHYALFTSSSTGRNDDYGYSPSGVQRNREKLNKIELFKKGDGTDELLKTIEFDYYANGAMVAASGNLNSKAGTSGKLMLKRIRVKSGQHNTKVYLNPYEFTYHEIAGHVYQPTQKDAWGYYQPEAVNEFGSRSLFPGVNQRGDYTNSSGQNLNRNEIASLYNLKTIKLPTGGIIEVNYEQDDYQYVQDEKARANYEIAGFGSVGDFDLSSDIMYIKLKETVTSQTEMEKLIQTILPQDQYIPFQAAVMLRKKPVTSSIEPQWVESDASNDDHMVEYISGYFSVRSTNPVTYDNVNCGSQCSYEYVKVHLQKKDLSNLGSITINPIRYAAFEHLFQNPMLILDGFEFDVSLSGSKKKEVIALINSIIGLAKTVKNSKDGFFVEANHKDYAQQLSSNGKSVVVLNAQNGRKYGGGIRVSTIKTKDNWQDQTNWLTAENTFDIVQEYTYELEDGSSSGVAEYEPGGIAAENPLRRPDYFAGTKSVLNSSLLMVEGPRMEAFYPSPSVGYSRVAVSKRPVEVDGTSIDTYSRSSDGVLIQEFNTAKDFPTIEKRTEIGVRNISTSENFTRFIGLKSYFHPGYSQGYAIELNNMHGKPKKTSTYGANTDPSLGPSASTVYEYYTSTDIESGKRIVQNEVDVLVGDGQVETMEIGVSMDAYIDMQESEVKTIGGGVAIDVEFIVSGWPIIIPTAIPTVDYYHALTRQIVTNKVITRNGILKKVITQQDGRTIEAENLLHDAENGNVLLTRVTNDFNAPIYTYNRPMHWLDEQFGATYQNSFALVNESNFQQILTPGDWISNLDGSTQYRVQSVNAWSATLEDESGNTVNSTFLNDPFIILESGYTNGTGNIYSEITSLKDPTNSSNRQFELFEKTTELDASFSLLTTWQELTNCDGDKIVFCFSDDPTGECVLIKYTVGEDASICDIEYAYASDPSKIAKIEGFPTTLVSNFHNFTVTKIGATARLEPNGGGSVYNLTWSDPLNLFPECLDAGVLNASFTTSVLGEQVLKLPQSSTTAQQDAFNQRPAFSGLKNSKYPQYNLTYFAQRNQSEAANPTAGFFDTDVSADGTYRNYIDYNHQSTPELNAPWVLGTEFTAFDPYGHALEQKDALGIYSAQIMDQNNILVLAKGLNARRDEVCFQSFEGYATGSQSMKDGNFTFSTDVSVISTAAHTGKKAVSLSGNSQLEFTDLDASTTYRVSFWAQQSSLLLNGQTQNASITNVDGWNLFHLDFNSNASGAITLTMNQNAVLDDIALRPLDGSMTAYVYDGEDLKLLAQFDDQHFATIYGYDDEDNLSFVKKETEKGIHTLTNYMTNKAQ